MHTLRYGNLVFHRMHSSPHNTWQRRLLCDRPPPSMMHLWLGTHQSRGITTWCVAAFSPQPLDLGHVSQSGKRHVDFEELRDKSYFEHHWNPRELYNEGTLAKLYMIFGPPPTPVPDGWDYAGGPPVTGRIPGHPPMHRIKPR